MEPREKLAKLWGVTVEELEGMTDAQINKALEVGEKPPDLRISPDLEEAMANAVKQTAAFRSPAMLVVNSEGVALTGPPERHSAVINTHTNGRFREEKIGGRQHIVTDMVPIVGDTVMNRILYPLDEVKSSFEQLSMIPAPAGHPTFNGENASAFFPPATNAHNIGGFIQNPRMDGAVVHNDFALDLEVAEKDERGRELIKRIRNKEKVGVSTGLTLRLENAAGTGGDGHRFEAIGHDFKFDHVAILLNEEAAGSHAGTQLMLNKGIDPIYVCNIDEKQLEDESEMTIEEMIEAVQNAGHTVLLKDSPEIDKLNISNEDLEAVQKMRQEAETALNARREELAQATETEAGDYVGLSLNALDVLIAKTKAPTAVDNAGRAPGGADEGGEDKGMTAADVAKRRQEILNKEN